MYLIRIIYVCYHKNMTKVKLTILIEPELRKEFKEQAQKHNSDASKTIRGMIVDKLKKWGVK
jgi:hypothetical protein